MAFFQDIKGKISSTWLVIILSMVLIYFSYHLLMGEHGWIGYQTLKKDLASTHLKLESLTAQEELLLYKINLLKTPIDPDLLEELAGKRLEYFSAQNKVLLSEEKKPF